MVKKLKFTEHTEPNLLKLDLGSGKGANTPEGFIKVDLVRWNGTKVVDLRKRWPWKSNSVDEVNANYLVHYFTPEERTHFANELYRVLKPMGTALIQVPHWCSARAYSDPRTWPVSESWLQSLNKGVRDAQNCVDTTGLTCDFDHTLGYGMHPDIITRHSDYQRDALMWKKEAAQDIVATLIKK